MILIVPARKIPKKQPRPKGYRVITDYGACIFLLVIYDFFSLVTFERSVSGGPILRIAVSHRSPVRTAFGLPHTTEARFDCLGDI